MAYLIQGSTLTAIADQVRRITGRSGSMTPAQITTALSGVTEDYFKFCDFSDYPTNYGDNGTDGNGNALTPYTVLAYLPKYAISQPSTSITLDNNYHIPILDKFANLIPGRTISNNRSILAEISMPLCTAIPDSVFDGCVNLASANFPACVAADYESFYCCEALEKVTLNSACIIEYRAFGAVLAPASKTFRLYLRGSTMGTCSDMAFSSVSDSSYGGGYGDDSDEPIPGLEIYVPPSLLSGFKTTWAGGAFARNIFALTD